MDGEDSLIDSAAAEMGSKVIHRIPRDPIVQECELKGMTVIQGAPDSDMASSYRKLSDIVLKLSDDSRGGMRLG